MEPEKPELLQISILLKGLQGPKPFLLFAGAGLSNPFPSCLPVAWAVVDLGAACLRPSTASQKELHAITYMPPEAFFETIDDSIRRDVPEAHKQIAFCPWLILSRKNVEPNAAHYLLVYLAARWKLPILTVNFDRLLEKAAHNVGLKPISCFKSESDEAVWLKSTGEGQVLIWKLHGDIEDLNIAVTTRSTGSKKMELIESLRSLFECYQSCIIGYTGRDLDIFPHILTFKLPQNNFWVDKGEWDNNFGMRLSGRRFSRIRADVQELAFRFFEQAKEDNELLRVCKERVQSIRALLPDRQPSFSMDVIPEECSALQRYFASAERRGVIWALLLARVGKYRDAKKYVEHTIANGGKLTNLDLWQAQMNMASVSHGMSKYKEQQKYSQKAAETARQHGLKLLEAQSLSAVTGAIQMQYVPNLGFKKRMHHLTFRERLQFVFTMCRHLLRMAWLTFPWPRGVTDNLDRMNAYVLFLDRLTTIWPTSQLIRKEQSRFGAIGFVDLGLIGNFYRKRHLSDPSLATGDELVGVSEEQIAAEIMGNKLRLAQIILGQAEILTSMHQMDAAIQKCELAQHLADEVDNPYTVLKALIGKRKAKGRLANSALVSACLVSIEGIAFQRCHDKLMVYLTTEN